MLGEILIKQAFAGILVSIGRPKRPGVLCWTVDLSVSNNLSAEQRH